MTTRLLLVLVLGAFVSACDGDGFHNMTGPSAMGLGMGMTNNPAQPPANQAQPMPFSMSGGWSGMFTDPGGNATAGWTMTHDGSQLMGPGTWSDFHGYHDNGTFTGVMMSDTDMSFAWEIPVWSMSGPMMMTACSLTINGVGQVVTGPTGPMTVTGTYSGTNSCAGPIPAGQFTLTRDR